MLSSGGPWTYVALNWHGLNSVRMYVHVGQWRHPLDLSSHSFGGTVALFAVKFRVAGKVHAKGCL